MWLTNVRFLFYYLTRDKVVYSRLRDEIDSVWDGKSPLDANMIGKPFCCDELFPRLMHGSE